MAENGFPQTSSSHSHQLYAQQVTGKPPRYSQPLPVTCGSTVTGYPIEGFNPTSSSTSEALPYPKLRTDFIILVITIMFTFLIEVTLFTFGTHLIPPLPDISVMSGSAGVHNKTDTYVIEDLDVGFSVANRDVNSMVFKNLTLLTYHGKERLSVTTLPPFEQYGEDHNTLWFKVKDLVVPIDRWDKGNRDDSTVGVSRVQFKLRARVRYRGRAWSRQEIPVKVDCYEVKISRINSNATERIPDLDTDRCDVQGLWNYLRSLLTNLAIFFPIALVVLGYLVVFLLVKFGVLSPEQFQ